MEPGPASSTDSAESSTRAVAWSPRGSQLEPGTADAIFGAMIDAVISMDERGTVIAVNAAVRELLGYPPEELIGRNVSTIMPRPDRDGHDGYPGHDAETGDARIIGSGREVSARHRDGHDIPVRLSVGESRSPRGRIFTGIIRDLREQQRLADERDRWFAMSRDLLCVASFDGRFTRLNPAWQVGLGWTLQELMADPIEHFVHPDDVAATRRELARLARGDATEGFEHRFRHRNGQYRWLSWVASPHVEREAIYASARDVTWPRRELHAGRLVQQSLVPRPIARADGFWLPARDIGGDFFSWIEGSDGSLAIFIGDVMGKGLPAALLTSAASMSLTTALRLVPDPFEHLADIVVGVNAQLGPYLGRTNAFVTLFAAVIRDGVCRFVDAGHGHALVKRSDGEVAWLRGSGLPLGVDPGGAYRSQDIAVGPGDAVVAFTDGFGEITDLEAIEGWHGLLDGAATPADAAAALRARVPRDVQRLPDDAAVVVTMAA